MKNNYGIAVPTYKREEEIIKLLANIPNNVDVYISDNGGFLKESFQSLYANTFVKKITPEIPMIRNWNSAAFSVEKKWLAIPGDDDVYYPESFKIIEKYLGEYANMDMIVFGHNSIDASGNILNSWRPKLESCIAPLGFLKFKYGVDARMPSVFIKTSLFKKLEGFDECLKMVADSDFFQRAALIGNVQFVPEIISGYRVWEGGITQNRIATVEWMEEIDRWCNRISIFCKTRNIIIYSRSMQDEIYARNIIAGIENLKKNKNHMAALKHFRRCRYPSQASLRTQARLLYKLVRP